MEYDRALYRVYERVLEDLSLSAPVFEAESAFPVREGVSGIGESHDGSDGGTNDNDNDDGNDVADSADPSPALAPTMTDRGMVSSRREAAVVPFILPLFVSPYAEALMEALSNEGSWRRFFDTVRYQHYHAYPQSQSHDGPATPDGTSGYGFLPATMRFINNIPSPLNANSRSFHRIDSLNSHPNTQTHANDPTQSQSPIHHAVDGTALHADVTTDADPEGLSAAIEMATIHTSSGLRRRPASTTHSTHTNSTNSTNSSIASSNASTTHTPTPTSTFDSNDLNALTITTPTTRMAQQIANNSLTHPPSNNTPNPRNNQNDHQDHNAPSCTQRGIYKLMRITMLIAICHLFVLILLHTTYVGGAAIKTFPITQNDSFTTQNTIHTNDKHMSSQQQQQQQQQQQENGSDNTPMIISRTCLEYALATRPSQQRSHYLPAHHQHDKPKHTNDPNDPNDPNEDDQTDGPPNGTQNRTSSAMGETQPPLLERNEIIQIIILYGESCTGQCSRVRTLRQNSTSNVHNTTDEETSGVSRYMTESHSDWFQNWRKLSQTNTFDDQQSNYEHNAHQNDIMSSPKFWEEPHFKYSTNEALMYLDNNMLRWHNVSLVNVTLTERCLSTGSDDGRYSSIKTRFAQFLSNIYGMNVIIINQLMYGIKINGRFQDGYIQNMASKERWSWSSKLIDTERTMRSDAFTWLSHKLSVIITSVLAFFLVTSVTAVTVRVLTSSGVVIMFPIFALFRHFGLNGADDRILGFSYPWIGRARIAIHRQRLHPQKHFVFAHLGKLFLFYIMYEACQSAWSSVFYGRSIPVNLPLWLFGYAMVWEYFSMIFVRSALSAYFFPRITLLYFLCYHIYFYSVPYGFFDVALIAWFLFMLHAMFFTVISLEVPGSARGVVSLEYPREVYSRLSWPAWSASLPNEWSLFLPLNSRYIPLHDRQLGDSDNSDANNEADNQNVAEDGEGIEMQDVNQNREIDEGNELTLPLGNGDTNTER